MDQVLPFVHANFRTDRSRMAIAGLSMGGWGALALGQRYYGHFRSISSYSGPADCNPATLDGAAVAGAIWACPGFDAVKRSEEHTSELQSRGHLVCRLLLEKKNIQTTPKLSISILN